MLIDASHQEETRVAVIQGNKVEEFDFESEHKTLLKGNIYLAKVTRVEPSLQAAFVEYGGNRHGFLAFNEIHPDYYQIPTADRKALIEAEALEVKRMQDEEENLMSEKIGEADDEDDETTEDEKPDEINADREDKDTLSEDTPKRRQTSRVGKKEKEKKREAKEVKIDDIVSEEDEKEKKQKKENKEKKKKGNGRKRQSKTSNRTAPRGRKRNGKDQVNDDDEISMRRPARLNYKIQEVIKRRQILLIQVVKEERGNKGAALTTYLSLAGRYCVLMPNTARGGGISRKIMQSNDRKRLKSVATGLKVPDGMGVIVRTAGASQTKPEIERDFEYIMRLWEKIREKTLESNAPCLIYEEANLIKRSIRDLYGKNTGEIIVEGERGHLEAKEFMTTLMPEHVKNVKLYKDKIPLFAKMGVEEQLDNMLQPQVTLKSGGYLVINQAEALVAIDVNSGKATRQHSIEETAVQTNLEAAQEVARQLRLRDLSGLIVIDFIDMDDRRNNRAVERKLRDALKSDKARIQMGRISPFGLMEMSRQRLRASMLESTTQICHVCQGVGHVRSDSSNALGTLRAIEETLNKNSKNNIKVKTRARTLVYMINSKREHISDLETRFDVEIEIVADDNIVDAVCEIEKSRASTKKEKIEEDKPIGHESQKPAKANGRKSKTKKNKKDNENSKNENNEDHHAVSEIGEDDDDKSGWWKRNFF